MEAKNALDYENGTTEEVPLVKVGHESGSKSVTPDADKAKGEGGASVVPVVSADQPAATEKQVTETKQNEKYAQPETGMQAAKDGSLMALVVGTISSAIGFSFYKKRH